MTFRRLAIAAAVLLLAVYLKLAMPVFGEKIVPALKDMLCEEQIAVAVPAGVSAWLGWD